MDRTDGLVMDGVAVIIMTLLMFQQNNNCAVLLKSSGLITKQIKCVFYLTKVAFLQLHSLEFKCEDLEELTMTYGYLTLYFDLSVRSR